MKKFRNIAARSIAGFLVGAALLLAACNQGFSPSGVREHPAAGPGTGTLSINFNTGLARNILPSLDFDRYQFTFTRYNGETPTADTTVVAKNKGEELTVTLPVGSYKLAVEAYKGEVKSAQGASAVFALTEGANDTLTVKLTGIVTGEGTGTFKYTISAPGGATVRELSLDEIDLGSGLTGSQEVGSGVYFLTISLADAGGKIAGYVEFVEIIDGQDTVFSRTFSTSNFFAKQVTGIAVSAAGSTTLTSAGATVQLSAAVTPNDATNLGVTWSSSNTEVATVSSSGLVSAVGNGTAQITATAADGSGVSDGISVTVALPSSDKSIGSVTVNGETLPDSGPYSFNIGEATQVIVAAVPGDDNAAIQYKLGDGAYQASGTFDISSYGESVIKIKVTAEDGTYAEYTLTVIKSSGGLSIGFEWASDGSLQVAIPDQAILSGESVTLTNESGLADYQWWVNGVKESQTASAYVFNKTEPGDYNVTVRAVKDGKFCSTVIVITVLESNPVVPGVISLDQSGAYSFSASNYGNETENLAAKTVQVSYSGSAETPVTVALSGPNAGSFILSASSLTVPGYGAATFTVKPKARGIDPGTHTATVTVSGNDETKSFTLSHVMNNVGVQTPYFQNIFYRENTTSWSTKECTPEFLAYFQGEEQVVLVKPDAAKDYTWGFVNYHLNEGPLGNFAGQTNVAISVSMKMWVVGSGSVTIPWTVTTAPDNKTVLKTVTGQAGTWITVEGSLTGLSIKDSSPVVAMDTNTSLTQKELYITDFTITINGQTQSGVVNESF